MHAYKSKIKTGNRRRDAFLNRLAEIRRELAATAMDGFIDAIREADARAARDASSRQRLAIFLDPIPGLTVGAGVTAMLGGVRREGIITLRYASVPSLSGCWRVLFASGETRHFLGVGLRVKTLSLFSPLVKRRLRSIARSQREHFGEATRIAA